MNNKVTFIQDPFILKEKIASIIKLSSVLPNQIFTDPAHFNFYFYDYYHCIDKSFISELYQLGVLAEQKSFKICTPYEYYKKKKPRQFFSTKVKMPYAIVDINCSEDEYDEVLEYSIEEDQAVFLLFDDLYWYFNSKCLIYGDKTTEMSVLALDKSILLDGSVRKKLMEVESFIERQTEMNLDPGIDVEEFKKILIQNYSNKN
ncbi:hypothetical protein [Listeria sp. PSOL-1]|uniref:hypothetical protein n=1 Tax=Listeria sp. PSOL-1 TaxID=1844999 RepID=UPI0013D07A96|nr:hypothetical protein [Listeria sp. PSOL-1]